jgi:hypothetical protein
MAAGEEVLRGPVGGLPIPFHASAYIEVIRFAASNLLCVDLDYIDEKGNRDQRMIEPYSLRRSANGDISLVAYNVVKNDWRSYRLDRIQGAQVANKSFNPRYEVELTPTGLLSAPPMQRSTQGRNMSATRPRATLGWNSGITYIYRCPLCNKSFRRKTMDGHLNPHKTPNGRPCRGSRGIYEGTR